MVTKVKGSVAPVAAEVLFSDDTDLQTFYENYTPSGFRTYNSSPTTIWTGDASSVDLTTIPEYDSELPIQVEYDLDFANGSTLGVFRNTLFHNSRYVVHVDFGFSERATLSCSNGNVLIGGETTRAGTTTDFTIRSIKQ